MLREKLIDDFFDDQPQMTFVKKLESFDSLKFTVQSDFDVSKRIAFRKVFLEKGEFESDEYLVSVFEDFDKFIKENKIAGAKFPVQLKKSSSFSKEEFQIEILDNGCEILAGEREGIRRAVIHLEDILCANKGNLEKGIIHKKPVFERRISRCFFSPINRPPRYGDELSDDIDYYSDGYLSKLMHNGINAIWIVSEFALLVRSSYITEFGEGSEKRLEKLIGVIEKCAKYGIQVFLFLIEPISLFESSLIRNHPNLNKKYPQVLGNSTSGPQAFCTFTEFGEKFLAEAVETLFINVPKLAGLMSITYGERVTSCANSWANSEGVWSNNCPHCGDKTRMEIVTHTVDIITKSMKKVSPEAEFISWTYAMRYADEAAIDEYVKKVSSAAILMQNFEDGGRDFQLGKKRFALDYYLCYTGPCDMYKRTAEKAREHGKNLYAKMQVCCSHELASMPYIPVPGIIYDKLTSAKKIGTKGIMESWFFGNYPCLMSKAVELLSYADSFKDKRSFLESLCGIYYKNEDVPFVADCFEYFEKGYKNYPVNVMFNYYGPMHDGIVWELSLLPKNFSLPRTWKLEDKTDGDRIGECLFEGHTMGEAIKLTSLILENWEKGCDCLKNTSVWDKNDETVQVSKALLLLFKSGNNILRFYKMRNDLGYGREEASAILSKMENLVHDEINNSKAMISLCKVSNSFGYHSEAEGYKFFPKKLEYRIETLKKLLSTEFPVTKERINSGLSPLSYFDGGTDGIKQYTAGRNGVEKAPWETLDKGKSKFRIAENAELIEMEIISGEATDFFVCNEFELMFPTTTYIFKNDGTVKLHRDAYSHHSILDEKIQEQISKWECKKIQDGNATHLLIRAKKKDIGFIRFPYKVMIRSYNGENWCVDTNPVRVLGKSTTSPFDFGWIM